MLFFFNTMFRESQYQILIFVIAKTAEIEKYLLHIFLLCFYQITVTKHRYLEDTVYNFYFG